MQISLSNNDSIKSILNKRISNIKSLALLHEVIGAKEHKFTTLLKKNNRLLM